MNLESAPNQNSQEIPTQEKKLSDRLSSIDVTSSNALNEVREAIDKNFNWSRKEIEAYELILDTIIGDLNEILDNTTTVEKKFSLYTEIKDYIKQLPDVSGLREKIEAIIISAVPDFENL